MGALQELDGVETLNGQVFLESDLRAGRLSVNSRFQVLVGVKPMRQTGLGGAMRFEGYCG